MALSLWIYQYRYRIGYWLRFCFLFCWILKSPCIYFFTGFVGGFGSGQDGGRRHEKRLDALHWSLLGVIAVLLAAFLLTPYEYHRIGAQLVRVHPGRRSPETPRATFPDTAAPRRVSPTGVRPRRGPAAQQIHRPRRIHRREKIARRRREMIHYDLRQADPNHAVNSSSS